MIDREHEGLGPKGDRGFRPRRHVQLGRVEVGRVWDGRQPPVATRARPDLPGVTKRRGGNGVNGVRGKASGCRTRCNSKQDTTADRCHGQAAVGRGGCRQRRAGGGGDNRHTQMDPWGPCCCVDKSQWTNTMGEHGVVGLTPLLSTLIDQVTSPPISRSIHACCTEVGLGGSAAPQTPCPSASASPTTTQL